MAYPATTRTAPHAPTPGWRFPLALVLIAIAVYLPVFHAGFVWDDDSFLTANPLIHAHDGLWKFWFSTRNADYWPITYSSVWLEWRLWGMHAAGYHLTNVLLHAAECVLLYRLLLQLKVPGAALAALLYAVHPVNVESVAWITQRKNLLAMLFYLLSLLAYSRERKGLSLLMFLFALLSKGSTVILPLVVAGIAWRRRRRFPADLLAFFALAALFTGINLWFQTHGPAVAFRPLDPLSRALGAGAIAGFYLLKAVIPYPLSFVYPAWTPAPTFVWFLPDLVLVAILIAIRRHAALRTAAAYFLSALLPVLGLRDIYFMRYAPVADHYQQLALPGILALAGAGYAAWRWRGKIVLAALVVLTFAGLTLNQAAEYRDYDTLCRATLARNPSSWLMRFNLGNHLLQEHQPLPARGELERALTLRPADPATHLALANVLQTLGDHAAALTHYDFAFGHDPALAATGAPAHDDFGNALRSAGRLPEAIAQYRQALQLNPDFAEAHNNLGVALANSGDLAGAIVEFEAALRIYPAYDQARQNLSLARNLR